MTDSTRDLLHDLMGTPDPRDPRAHHLLRLPADRSGIGWALLGLPYDGGIPSRPGARFGPVALRRALATFGTFDGRESVPPLEDFGDLALPSMDGAEAHSRIETAAQRLFGAGRRLASIGGDHGCTGSVIRGFAAARPDARLALISIDAHLDVREYDGATAVSSGTPFRRALETSVLEGARTAMIGLRPFANSAYYVDWAHESGIHLFSVDDVAETGPAKIAADALASIGGTADAFYFSVDLDAADAAYAPGVSAPGTGGLTSREMIGLVRVLASDPRLVGFDLMELSPPYDVDDRTARLAARLLLEVMRANRS